MAGILSVFNDFAPEGYDHFERWYNREHLQERVNVPGFRFGRRYELAVRRRPPLLRLLRGRQPGRAELAGLRRAAREPDALDARVHEILPQHGAHGVRSARGGGRSRRLPCRGPARRRDDGADRRRGRLAEKLAAEPGVARVQLWTAAARQTPSDTAEMKARGKDAARRRRLRGRVRAPRRRGSGRRHARQAAARARHLRQDGARRLWAAVRLYESGARAARRVRPSAAPIAAMTTVIPARAKRRSGTHAAHSNAVSVLGPGYFARREIPG